MIRGRLFGLVAVGVLALAAVPSGSARADDVRAATLNWPPYTARDLAGGGFLSEIVREAFAAIDEPVTIDFLPWNRAIARAKHGARSTVAYFPGYHCKHTDGFVPSRPFAHAPLGFAERSADPIAWEDLDDLTDYRIGIVVGYANTEAFDARVRAGDIEVVTAADDVENLQRLLDGRVDAAVVDREVMKHILSTDPRFEGRHEALRMNERLLKVQGLHLCFPDTEDGRALRDRLDAALADILGTGSGG